MKVALITGVAGQDGSYLAELLLKKGYEVHGLVRCVSNPNLARIKHLIGIKGFCIHYGDLIDQGNLRKIVKEVRPDEVYNLAALSHVGTSFNAPEYTAQVNGTSVLHLLEIVREIGSVRFYQAATSELFGNSGQGIQNEITPFHPRSPYAIGKLFAYWSVVNFREAYGMYACNGILFNHESPRRGENFVTRKISLAVAKGETVRLGNLNARRDWGYAPDYVEAMWMMLQQDEPEDFVIATGQSHSIRDFVECAFREVGKKIIWEGIGIDEVGIDQKSGEKLVTVDPEFFRPAEVDYLCGDTRKAREILGWKPHVSFEKLVQIMVEADLELRV